MAYKRGDPRVCSIVRPPSVEEEDRRRLGRERKTLVAERIGTSIGSKACCSPRESRLRAPAHDRRARLEDLRTGVGRPLPAHVKAQISSRAGSPGGPARSVQGRRGRRGTPCSRAEARRLLRRRHGEPQGIGPEFAAVLWLEAFFRHFDNRRQIAAYAGLAATPWKSGSIDHEQGVSKAGKRTAANHDDPIGLAVAEPPARLGLDPLVRGAGERRADARRR